MLYLTFKKLNAFKFDGVAESDNTAAQHRASLHRFASDRRQGLLNPFRRIK